MYTCVIMVVSIYMNVHLLTTGLAPALRLGALEKENEHKKSKLAAVLEYYNVPRHLQKQVFTIYPFVLEASMHDMQEVGLPPPNLAPPRGFRHCPSSLAIPDVPNIHATPPPPWPLRPYTGYRPLYIAHGGFTLFAEDTSHWTNG